MVECGHLPQEKEECELGEISPHESHSALTYFEIPIESTEGDLVAVLREKLGGLGYFGLPMYLGTIALWPRYRGLVQRNWVLSIQDPMVHLFYPQSKDKHYPRLHLVLKRISLKLWPVSRLQTSGQIHCDGEQHNPWETPYAGQLALIEAERLERHFPVLELESRLDS